MFKLSKFLYTTVTMCLVTAFLLLVPSSVSACEEEPQTLLSLYLNSDLIVLANYEGNKSVKREEGDEYGYGVEIERNLSIVHMLKGQADIKNVSFTNYEYHINPNSPAIEVEPMESYDLHNSGYVNIEEIKIGSKYLFFLTKNEDSGSYTLTDYMAAVKDVNGKYDIYETSINELKAISETKENQAERFTEWIVKSIEEPETRRDGISDLSTGLYAVTYAEENSDVQNKPFVFDKNFDIYESKFANHLNDSQKQRISSILYPMLQEAWFSSKPEYAQYGIENILGSFNRSRLAVYSYNMLKSIDKKDSERQKIIMSFISNVVIDSELSDVYYNFVKIDDEINSKDTKTAEELKVKNVLRNNLLKNFDKRFEFMLQRNFKPVPEKG